MHRGKYLLLSVAALCAGALPACLSFPEEGTGPQPVEGEVSASDVDEHVASREDSRSRTYEFSKLTQELSASFVPAPGGARRLLQDHYLRAIAEMLGPDAAAAAAPPPDGSLGGVGAVAAFELATPPVSVDEYEYSALLAAAAAVASPARLAEQAPCVTQGPTDPEFREFCYREVAHRIGFLAWRLPPLEEDKDRLVEIALLAEDYGTTDAERLELGITYVIATLLQSPSFLYSVEVGVDAGTSRQLNGFEIATRMSLFLLGTPPDEELLRLAADGGLDTPTDVRNAALSLLATPQARQGFVDHLGDLFQLKLLEAKGKDTTAYPQYDGALAASMAEEVHRFVEDIVFDNPVSFLEILRSEKRFIDTRLVNDVYGGVPSITNDWDQVDFSISPLDTEERAGILTMPAVLAVFSHGVLNSPTRRGLFVREQLFCDTIPPPPDGVDLDVKPPPAGMSLREQLETQHKSPGCAGCHNAMDPIGFGLEHFDAIGQWRTHDNGVPVDSSIDSPDFAGTLSGPRELANAMVADARIPMCWIEQLHTAAVGSIAGPGSPPRSALEDLEIQWIAAGYDMQTLLADMVSSPAFLQVAPLD